MLEEKIMKIKSLLIIQLLSVLFLFMFLANEVVEFSREMVLSIKSKMFEQFLNRVAGSFRGIEYSNDTQILIFIFCFLFLTIMLVKTMKALRKIFTE